jgi:hypothetical protein
VEAAAGLFYELQVSDGTQRDKKSFSDYHFFLWGLRTT